MSLVVALILAVVKVVVTTRFCVVSHWLRSRGVPDHPRSCRSRFILLRRYGHFTPQPICLLSAKDRAAEGPHHDWHWSYMAIDYLHDDAIAGISITVEIIVLVVTT